MPGLRPLPLKMEIFFFFFKKINSRLHVPFLDIFFARTHENAKVTENGTIFLGSMCIHWYPTL